MQAENEVTPPMAVMITPRPLLSPNNDPPWQAAAENVSSRLLAAAPHPDVNNLTLFDQERDNVWVVMPDIPGEFFTAAAVYIAAIGIFGFTANLTVIIAYWRVTSVSACPSLKKACIQIAQARGW